MMQEVGPSYLYYPEYCLLRDKVMANKSPEMKVVVGKTHHYGLPDFRLEWNGIRVIDIFPRPKGVELLLEYSKILDNRQYHDPGEVDRLEDAAGAIIHNKNRLLVVRSKDEIDEDYLDAYLEWGIKLYLAELKRRRS